MQFKTITGNDLAAAARYLATDYLVAIPTETVYGLAANAFSPTAIEKVFAAKKRPTNHPLIVHVADLDALRALATAIPPAAMALLETFSPGPLTVLLPASEKIPAAVNGGLPTVAFRIPAHPLTQALLKSISFPLVAPSANLFTTISPTQTQHVLKNFDGVIPYILNGGPCEVGVESTVVGFDAEGSPVIYRPGSITEEDILSVTGSVNYAGHSSHQPSPGMMSFHYAPRTRTLFTENLQESLKEIDGEKTGVMSFSSPLPMIPSGHQFILSPSGHLGEAARRLYEGLHFLDDKQFELIIVEKIPGTGLAYTLNDRLRKAAHAFCLKNEPFSNPTV